MSNKPEPQTPSPATAPQPENWRIPYALVNASDGKLVARGEIKDHPSSAEALCRMGERICLAVTHALLAVSWPEPWKLVLRFTVERVPPPGKTLKDCLLEELAAAGLEVQDVPSIAAAIEVGVDLTQRPEDPDWP